MKKYLDEWLEDFNKHNAIKLNLINAYEENGHIQAIVSQLWDTYIVDIKKVPYSDKIEVNFIRLMEQTYQELKK